MKNVLKILLGMFVTLVYIPFSIVTSYTIISMLTNIFNEGYKSILLNVVFGLIGLITLLVLVLLLEKIICKVVERKIRFMAICTIIPIIIFCIGMLILNFNFFNLQKDMLNIDVDLLSDSGIIKVALMSLSSVFFVVSFIYLIVFVMYIIVYKFDKFKKKKANEI